MDALCNYGLLLALQEKDADAEALYKRALKITPNDVDTLVNYSCLKMELQQFDEAEEMYQKILAIDATDGSTGLPPQPIGQAGRHASTP